MTYLILFIFLWQQRVSYKIDAKLDVNTHTLNEISYLVYYNNSPFPLETLYLHLYANAYRDNNTTFARELKNLGDLRFQNAKLSERGWIDILSVTCGSDSLKYSIDETIMAVLLKNPLPSGDSVVLKIESTLKIPKILSRLGYKGRHYEIVQWYPKFCVFDEQGWHKDTYHTIGEFYGEYGRYDVKIELPSDYIVAATGELIDSTVLENKRKVMHYIAEDVHDFAWVCDVDFGVAKKEVDGIVIEVYYIMKYKKRWQNALDYATDAITRYNQWYGRYPYKRLCIVHGYIDGGMEYPNLVIIGGCEDNFTRRFEQVIVHEIAHQWFYGILGSNEMDEAWLDEGFATYTEMRYFIDKYGIDNSFFKFGIIPQLPHNFINRLIYYITQTNQIEFPVLTKSSEFVDIPIAYQNSAYSKPGLFLYYLQGYLGSDTFDLIMKEYFVRYKFKHPNTRDFINLCEEISGKDLNHLFEDFLKTTKYCDWQIKEIKKDAIVIENKGELLLPVDLFVQTDDGAMIFKAEKSLDTLFLPDAQSLKRVAIDPYDRAFESNRFNNFYPRKFAIKPFFSWPSFDTYQVLFLPYLWYNKDNGFTPGLYLAGAQFIDFDFVKGRNQWLFGYIYGTKSKKHNFSFSYQTPVVFKRGYRLRVFLKGSNGNDELRFQSGIMNNIGIPFTTKPEISIKNYLGYNELKSYHYVDSIDWSVGKYYYLQNEFQFRTREWTIGFEFNPGYFNEQWKFLKLTFEIEHKQKLLFFDAYLRVFNGRIFGTPPNQEKIFLCGGLRHNFITGLFFSDRGRFSPQEHIHIKGDANMLGYQGMHIKTNRFSGFNLQIPDGSPVRIFLDYGYYYDDSLNWQNVWDMGVRIDIGPLGFILPIHNHKKFFPKNWSIELTMPKP